MRQIGACWPGGQIQTNLLRSNSASQFGQPLVILYSYENEADLERSCFSMMAFLKICSFFRASEQFT